jgi:hypothetical protein
MRADFHRDDEPDTIVGTARWTGGDVDVEAEDPKVRRALGASTGDGRAGGRPLAPILRDVGPRAAVAGSLRWFVACAQARSPAERLAFRLTPDPSPRMGWDPAGAYQRFPDQVEGAERLASTDEL